MFEWLKTITAGGETGLPKMTRDLERMLHEGRHAFDMACSVLLGGADPSTVREDLRETDLRIDRLEQSIRRQIVVHGSVHGARQIPELMVLMSVAKDAERIGDYSKNLFALARLHVLAPGTPHHDDLQSVRQEMSSLLADAPELFERQDREEAHKFVQRAQVTIDLCETRMEEIFTLETCTGRDALCALAYRHMRRVGGHVQNVITAVVNPVDKLDFADEPALPEDDAEAS
jgi:phosphate uptake regulator